MSSRRAVTVGNSALGRKVADLFSEGKNAYEVAETIGGGMQAEDAVKVLRQYMASTNVLSELEQEQLLIHRWQSMMQTLDERIREKHIVDDTGKAGPDAAYLTIWVNSAKELFRAMQARSVDIDKLVAEYDASRGRQLAEMVTDGVYRLLDEMVDRGEITDSSVWKQRFKDIIMYLAKRMDER